MYLALSKFFVENVHWREFKPIPKAIASKWIKFGLGSVLAISSKSVFLSIKIGTLISTVPPLLVLMFFVRDKKISA